MAGRTPFCCFLALCLIWIPITVLVGTEHLLMDMPYGANSFLFLMVVLASMLLAATGWVLTALRSAGHGHSPGVLTVYTLP